MADRSVLPDAPDENTRRVMEAHFTVSDGYDGGPACQAIIEHIRAGRVTFWLPDRVQLTKTGLDYLERLRSTVGEIASGLSILNPFDIANEALKS